MYRRLALASSMVLAVRGQQAGTQKTETHPALTWQECTAEGSCTTNNGMVVVDANWRWLHDATAGSYTNCYTGNTWDATLCPNNTQCAANCALEGADYSGTYGATTSGDSLKLSFVTQSTDKNIGSRMYLMDTDTTYQQFSLLNKEFTFDVDVSNLPCGLNGALYFVSMDADGGMAKNPTNKAGAKYGTGYCDSQCPRDLKFINGQANVEGWVPSTNDANAGVGNHGSCCAEMDVWEANSISAAYTPHPCDNATQVMCEGDACGGTYSDTRYAGTCDPDGCDFNSYRMGDTSFYGPAMTVDTSKVFTVVTQFIGSPLTEIKRFYVQDGVVIPNSQSKIANVTGNSLTTDFCDAQKTAFGDENIFETHGGMTAMGEALSGGMTLVMSVWDDHYANMLWLDSENYPVNSTGLGSARGTCATTSGVPSDIETSNADASVTFSNIKFGPINSTFSAGSVSSSTGSSSSVVASVAKSASASVAGSVSTAAAVVAAASTSKEQGAATSVKSAASSTFATKVSTAVASTSTAAESVSTSASSSGVTEPTGTTLGDLLSWVSSFFATHSGTSYDASTVARR